MSMALLMLKAQVDIEEKKQRTLKVILGNAINPDALYSFRRLVLWYGGGDGPIPNPQSWAIRKSVKEFGRYFVVHSKTSEAEGGPIFLDGIPLGSETEIVFDSFDGPDGLGPVLEYVDTIASIATRQFRPAGAKPFDRDTIIRTALMWWDIQLMNKGLLP